MKWLAVILTTDIAEKEIAFVKELSGSFEKSVFLVTGSNIDDNLIEDFTKKHTNVSIYSYPCSSKGGSFQQFMQTESFKTLDFEYAMVVTETEGLAVEGVRECVNSYDCQSDCIILGTLKNDIRKCSLRYRFSANLTALLYRLACGIKLSNPKINLLMMSKSQLAEISHLKGNCNDYCARILTTFKTLKHNLKEVQVEGDKNTRSEGFYDGFLDMVKSLVIVGMHLLKFVASALICYLIDIGVNLVMISILGNAWGLNTDVINSYSLATAIITGKWNIYISAVLISMLVARLISAPINFLLNKKAVFKSNDSTGQTAGKYALLAGCQFTVTFLLVDLFANGIFHVTGFPYILITCIVQICCFLASFGIQRKWIFKNKSV